MNKILIIEIFGNEMGSRLPIPRPHCPCSHPPFNTTLDDLQPFHIWSSKPCNHQFLLLSTFALTNILSYFIVIKIKKNYKNRSIVKQELNFF